MNRRKIIIISIVVILVIVFSFGAFYFSLKNKILNNNVQPSALTEQDKINIIEKLNQEPKSTLSDQQKNDLLNNLSNSSNQKASQLTQEQKTQLIQLVGGTQ